MIIIGYQGIGKSTCCSERTEFIDLESSSFWVDGKRDPNWHIVYAQIAEHLSKQGYVVFTSSHQALRDYLRNSIEQVVEIYPSLELKEKWLRRLKYRLITNPSEKNKRAFEGAVNYYNDNIKSFMTDRDHSMYLELRTVNYKLEDVVDSIDEVFEIWNTNGLMHPVKNRLYYTEEGNVFSM